MCKLPIFGDIVHQIVDAIQVMELPEERRLHIFNKCIHEASRVVRDFLLVHHPDGTEIQGMIVFSTARAIWRQNTSLASKLIKTSPLAASFLKVEGNKVFLSNASQFNMYYDDARMQISNQALTKLATRMQFASSALEAKKVKCKIQATKRFMALFWKQNRCMKLSGIRLSSGNVAL